MPDPPFFSILCVCRNEERFLPAGIASIQAQTEPSWELILVDDRSADSTFDIMSAAAAADPRITAVRNPSEGKIAGYNQAAAVSRGRWVHLLGGDDELAPTCLEECRRLIEASPGSLVGVYHDYAIVSKESGEFMGNSAYGPWLESAPMEAVWRKKFIIGGGFMVVKGEVARTLIWPQPTHWYSEDHTLAAALKALGDVRYLARPLYIYRMPASHHSSTPTLDSHRRGLMHFGEGLQLFLERNPPSNAIPAAAVAEAGRHLRHHQLMKKQNWGIGEALGSRLRWNQFAMALIVRYAPALFPKLVFLYRRWWNIGIRTKSIVQPRSSRPPSPGAPGTPPAPP